MRNLVAFALLSLLSSFGQTASVTVRGEVQGANEADRLSVVFIATSGMREEFRVFVQSSGAFELQHVPPGNYWVEVRSQDGRVIQGQLIMVTSPAFDLVIRLPPAARPVRDLVMAGSSQRISVSRLLSDPDGKAVREFAIAQDYLRREKLASARKHLESALKADPEFAEAHAELGVVAYRSGNFEEAKSEFVCATKLDAALGGTWANLASIHFNEHNYEAAEEAALQGLAQSPKIAKLHYLAGAAQLARRRVTKETIAHFEQAAEAFPQAAEILSKLRK